MEKNRMPDTVTKLMNTCSVSVQRLLNATIRKPVSSLWQMGEWMLIKYLYLILTLLILKDQYYYGPNGYHIDFVFWKEIIAFVVFVAISACFLTYRVRDYFLRNLMQVLFVLYFIPVNSTFSLNNSSFGFFLLSHLFFLLLYGTVLLMDRFAVSKVKTLRPVCRQSANSLLSNRNLNAVFFGICILYVIHKISYNGLDFSLSLASDDVYSTRADYQMFLQEISGTLFAYVLALVRYLVSAIVAFYIVSALSRKKWSAIACLVITVLSMYSVAMQKSILFVPLMAVGVYCCGKLKILKHFDRVFISGMLLLLVGCAAEHMLLKTDRIYMLFVRREMYYPAWLNHLYYDFFSENDKVLWTQNVFLFQNILTPVYEVSPLELISNAYFQGQIPSPNTGLFAEAYMHFGFAGILLYPIGLAVVFSALGLIYRDFGPGIQIIMLLKLALSLTNVSIVRTDSVISIFFFAAMTFILPRLDLSPVQKAIRAFSWPKLRKQMR